MIEKIKKIIASNNKISAWIISESVSRSLELFYVKDKLDMNRATNVHEYSLRIFVDFNEDGKKYRGESKTICSPSDTEEELKNKIDRAVFSAGFVKNLWYPLPCKDNGKYIDIVKHNNIDDLKNNYEKIHNILFKKYDYNSKLNSCELFAIESDIHVVSSEGVDICYPFSEFTFEIVTDNNTGKEPVEIFNDYSLPNIDLEKFSSILEKQLSETDGRSKAQDCPKIDSIKLILSGDAVEELLSFYVSQATDNMIYMNISKLELNKPFLPKDSKQSVSISLNPNMPSSIYSTPIDSDGKRLEKYTIFDNNIAVNLRTSSRFAHYMNIENKGNVSTFEVEPGTHTYQELTNTDYIEILTFSSFIMDSTTGDFGGEFRLAKLVQNGKVSYVSGGAISENIFNVQNKMIFSKELEARKYSICPKAIAFDDITVASK